MIKNYLDMLTAIGAIATAGSVIWAIYTYRRAEERRSFSRVREVLSDLKEYISQLDGFLSEPEFSMLGSCISKQIMALKPREWSFPQFTAWLEGKENHDQIAQAIHVGRLECDFVEKTEETVKNIRKSPTFLKEKLPIISAALSYILFYVIEPGRTVLSPSVFSLSIGNAEAVQEMLHEQLEKIEHIEQYANEIALFISMVPQVLFSGDRFGQKTFDLSEIIANIIIESFSRLSDSQLRESSKNQIENYEKIQKIDNEHAIEDAIEILQFTKNIFTEDEWDKIIECKGKILQLMDNEDEQNV